MYSREVGRAPGKNGVSPVRLSLAALRKVLLFFFVIPSSPFPNKMEYPLPCTRGSRPSRCATSCLRRLRVHGFPRDAVKQRNPGNAAECHFFLPLLSLLSLLLLCSTPFLLGLRLFFLRLLSRLFLLALRPPLRDSSCLFSPSFCFSSLKKRVWVLSARRLSSILRRGADSLRRLSTRIQSGGRSSLGAFRASLLHHPAMLSLSPP